MRHLRDGVPISWRRASLIVGDGLVNVRTARSTHPSLPTGLCIPPARLPSFSTCALRVFAATAAASDAALLPPTRPASSRSTSASPGHIPASSIMVARVRVSWVVAALTLVVSCVTTTHVAAHSSLVSPLEETYENACRLGGVNRHKGVNCPGPCPTKRKRKNYRVVTFRRGQRTPIEYLRNNHKGGFLRLSLVPVHQKMSHAAHARNAFRWSCWSHGRIGCGRGDCGTDRTRSRYRQHITIPDVFPDGDYMLGYAWYGGSFQQGDYYSCAHVRVQGGAPLRASYTATLEHARGGKCESTANRLGVCRREPCRGRRRTPMSPAEFSGSPPKILSSSIDARMGSPDDGNNRRNGGNNWRNRNKWRKKNNWRQNRWRRNKNQWNKNKRWQRK